MRLVFAGTPDTAVPALDALLASRHEVAAVVTRPDAPSGRGRKVEATVLDSPARKLAVFRWPAAIACAQRSAYSGDDGITAMELQLGHILAGLAARTRKPERQRLVNDFATCRIAHARKRCLSRRRNAACSIRSTRSAGGCPSTSRDWAWP